ncbi:hypothetical protein DBIPINDM_007694 (plasmid) [Mesorhizobium sp. AR02]|uniref:hypothetical protein n=1 Tax=Mesorhizobium sp. AR02 TaxID=2865837 RepID=UPI00215F940F|nr:hypothetical protein [Mesorhizobium sp. AR02]UVK49684.1 hypothetical protein DBIPINDM_007694 [Mesorhizobium sp. AR02]
MALGILTGLPLLARGGRRHISTEATLRIKCAQTHLMREIRTSGLMSGEGKRSDANTAQATAPFLDSTGGWWMWRKPLK